MSDMDTQRTADIIEKMRLARIGEYAKWEIMLGKLENEASAIAANPFNLLFADYGGEN